MMPIIHTSVFYEVGKFKESTVTMLKRFVRTYELNIDLKSVFDYVFNLHPTVLF